MAFRNPLTILRQLFGYWRVYGVRALLRKLKEKVIIKIKGEQFVELQKNINPNNNEIENIIGERFSSLYPLKGFYSQLPGKRINVVTDSINSGSLFGGVATALILSSLMAEEWDCALRIITRTEKPKTENFYRILQLNNIPFSKNVEFIYAPTWDFKAEFPVMDGDVFLTTSWWTTWSTREAFGSKKIIYLLQEDERTFYPYSDDRFRCVNVFEDPQIRFVINTKLLYDHFVNDGLNSIRDHGFWFEPSFPENLLYFEEQQKNKYNFFFYARPINLRNLYYLGIDVINSAVQKNILNPDEWNFNFVGKDLPQKRLQNFYNANVYQNIPWSEYAQLVRGMDLGLSLMYSPHPSYPPFDLAASGAVVVTNKYGLKQNLDFYSKNILCFDLNKDALVEGLRQGVALARNSALRMSNYRDNSIQSNWKTSFADILEKLKDV
ncbi:MAG: hypothetical protein CVU39_21200 [Chloroflexi bacterium HGW-Chloroflexi-10]|nr:MAG: hypothetical protein CVU39_21200 [Chloroflexi bacterium HGW-Chloroflexi-10]